MEFHLLDLMIKHDTATNFFYGAGDERSYNLVRTQPASVLVDENNGSILEADANNTLFFSTYEVMGDC
jgi:hypothetical protein